MLRNIPRKSVGSKKNHMNIYTHTLRNSENQKYTCDYEIMLLS